MSTLRNHWVLLTLPFLLVLNFSIMASAQNAAPLDSTLYTNYTTDANLDTLTWIVCGSLPGSSGCYGAGSIGPFGKVGAMIEGNPSTAGSVVTRAIYVVDVAAGVGANQVVLNVFKKTDTITNSSDTISVTLTKTATLPLTGGASVSCFMAANKGFLFFGTDQTAVAVEVKKSNLNVTQISVTGGINVSSITADQYGYVTVTQGSPSGGATAFGVWGPTGSLQEDGGGTQFMLNTINAVLPSMIPQ
jgi:hypothetical protein